jgi:hypothetical protein
MTEYNSKAHLELIDKQAKLLEQMMTPQAVHHSVSNKDKMMEEALEAAHAAIKDLSLRVVEKPSLRDQFAMAALTGVLAGRVVGERTEWAKAAYEIADKMMEARK